MSECKAGMLGMIPMSKKNVDTLRQFLEIGTMGSGKLYEIIYQKMGQDGLIEMLDVLAGCTVRLPSRDALHRLLTSIRIYNYYLKHNKEYSAISSACKLCGKNLDFGKSSVVKLTKYLEGRYIQFVDGVEIEFEPGEEVESEELDLLDDMEFIDE